MDTSQSAAGEHRTPIPPQRARQVPRAVCGKTPAHRERRDSGEVRPGPWERMLAPAFSEWLVGGA